MPSPFPGMDPYLENPAHFRGVHARFITTIAEILNDSLPEGLVADIEERVFVIPPLRPIYPDVMVVAEPVLSRSLSRRGAPTMDTATEPMILTLSAEPGTERYVSVRTVTENSELVAVIEVLSPANKDGAKGTEQYRKKQDELLYSDVHLLEIDLLRAGQHMVAPPQWLVRERAAHWDYLVSLHRARLFWEYEVWSATVRDTLPTVLVPLLDGMPDALLPLSTVFDRVYDAGPYAKRTDYGIDPLPPLAPDDAAWADALLREKGLRP